MAGDIALRRWQVLSGAEKSAEAEREMKKIARKLEGVMESTGPAPLPVQAQVQQLISDASSLSNLSQMYIWWMPCAAAHRARRVQSVHR